MSKTFLTKTQAGSKLNASGLSGTRFVTKQECLDNGASIDLLSAYASTAYPIDDHIIQGTTTPVDPIPPQIQFSFSITPIGLADSIDDERAGEIKTVYFDR